MYCDSHGTPAFSVKAENQQDKELISHFMSFGEQNKQYHFWLHSSCWTDGKAESFFFGYHNPEQMKKYLKKENVFRRIWKAIKT
jgi:hypothetical protein